MSTALHLQKQDTKSRDLASSTAASGAPIDGKNPLTEFTVVEMLALRRFFVAAQTDLLTQLGRHYEEARRQKIHVPGRDRQLRDHLKREREAAETVSTYIAAILGTLDQMLGVPDEADPE